MWLYRAAAIAVLSALALGSATGRSDDGTRAAPQQAGVGFLEFLGSVDRLSDVNPDYLSQPPPAKAVKPAASSGTKPPPPPPPPAPSPSGAKNNG